VKADRVGEGKSVLIVSNMRRDLPGWTESIETLEAAGFTVHDDGRTLTDEEMGVRIATADALIVAGSMTISGAVLRHATRLRIIAKQGIGVDTIDVETASELGIPVCNTAGSNSESVADHTFALMLGLVRKIRQLDAATRAGKGWNIWPPPVEQIAGKAIAIVGTGNVGSRVARRAAAGFDMRVLGNDIVVNRGLEIAYGVRFGPLEEIIGQADIVSLHVPLTPLTRGLVGESFLSQMRPTSMLINTSRGEIVDEAALGKALRSGEIAAAGLDVYETEPCLDSPLFGLENVLLTPHSAGQSTESSTNGRVWSAENVIAAFQGSPRNVVNPSTLTP
jgi:D-3-phosphoglycerate dehydrogenase / 2-oxoglutarate reductase